jgi:molecular chaperone GrpE
MDLSDLHKEPQNQEASEEQQQVKQEWLDKGSSGVNELKAKYEDLEDSYKRLWADQQNMLNRFNRERQDIQKYATINTLQSILPAIDNFDFAKKSLTENTSFTDIVKSIDMLREQLIMSLKAVGLEEVDTNCLYNPELHEAVSNIAMPDKEEGTIIEVLKKGYRIKDKVVRVATVVVSSKA